ncbi:MAG: thymidine phosphorylase, partial [Planctomycetota bacterium]
MNIVDLICKKRDGKTLDATEIEWLIESYTKDKIPDYQMAALAMAVYFKGMELDETVALTRSMLESGEFMKWSNSRLKVDKHSTGGIGDKVSIILAPLLAAADVDVPMISGRGLGFTGGTLDKLDSIPGFASEMSLDEFRYTINRCGCAIVSASEQLAVADRKLYALRDVTGTIPSIPLITASILSKKLAAGLNALVLDVKWGTGAFMKTVDEARNLARSLVQVGNALGVKTTAMISDMNQPLGHMIGNACEIDESEKVLQNGGPDDVRELVLQLGAEVLVSAGKFSDHESAVEELEHLLLKRKAEKKWNEMVAAQHGDLKA